MADLHDSDVERAYAAATDDARRTVAAAFDLYDVGSRALPETANRGRYRAVWRVTLPPGDPAEGLMIAVPWTFPDELPDIFLDSDLEYDSTRIPHLDENLQLCTYDDSVRFPNPALPGESVLEVIERARQTMRHGIAGTNRSEYWDEFDAYWTDGAKNLDYAFSVVNPTGPPRRVVIAPLAPTIATHRHVFAEDHDSAAAFLTAIDRLTPNLKTRPALYLHLESLPTINIRTNAEALSALSDEARDALLEYLDDVERPSTVLFSLPVGRQRIFGAWRHEQYGFDVYRGKDSRRVKGEVRGVRRGHLSAERELTTACGGQRLGRYVVRRVDSKRLVTRTRGEARPLRGATNIIGCGSVGGILARTMATDRPESLRLFDNETLEVQNVPRHICDITFVGANKADAVRALLRRSDPSLVVEAHAADILDVIRGEAAPLVPAERTIVAVANIAVERRLNSFARAHDVGDVAFVWIEAHAVAGHAVIVPRGAVGCFECLLTDNFTVGAAVLEDGARFDMRDAGCGASFVPYAGVDLELFGVSIAHQILRSATSSTGTVITWIGDLTAARQNGWMIRDEWKDAADYSVHRRDIVAKPSCSVCGEA